MLPVGEKRSAYDSIQEPPPDPKRATISDLSGIPGVPAPVPEPDSHILQHPGFGANIQIPTASDGLPVRLGDPGPPHGLQVVPRGLGVDRTPPLHCKPATNPPRKQKLKHNTTLLDLIEADLLSAGQTLCFIRSTPPCTGTLLEDGTISAHFNDAKYNTIGGFAIAAHRHSGGAGKGIDGWRTVKPKDQNMFLASLRSKYEEEHKGSVSYVPSTDHLCSRKTQPPDPNAPKKPLCAFIRYFQSMMGQMKVQNPALSHGQISRHIGKQWLELPPHERQPYIDIERQMTDRYSQLLQGHDPSSVVPAVLPSLPMSHISQMPMPQMSMHIGGHRDIDMGQISAPGEHLVPPPQSDHIDVSAACLPGARAGAGGMPQRYMWDHTQSYS